MKPSSDAVSRLVVTDTGPLIALARSGYLHLLPALFGRIVIPASVSKELRLDDGLPGSSVLRTALRDKAIYQVIAAKNVPELLSELLDPGEAEAIALAEERSCLLLIDERKGRTVARKRGIPFVGTGRLLIAAKRNGDLDNVSIVLEEFRRSGYRLSDSLYEEILRLAGE